VLGSKAVDSYVLVQMNGWRIWRSRATLELSGVQALLADPDEEGSGRPPFESVGAGDQLEVSFEATQAVFQR
jgi:hypothetical protein